MAIYSVHNRDGHSPEQAVFVAEGFSVAAFVFGFIWALWNRMWLVAALLVAVIGLIAVLGNVFPPAGGMTAIASFAVSLIFGFEALDLHRTSLVRAGYREIGLSHGRTLEEAELNYYLRSGRTASRPPAPAPPKLPLARHSTDPLGIFGNA